MSRKSSTRSDSAISMSSPTAASYCDNAIMRIRDLHISESAAQESINNSGRSAQRERCGFLVRRVTRMEDLRRIQRFSFSLPPPFFHFFLPSFFCYLCYSFFSLCSSFFFFSENLFLLYFVFRHKCMKWKLVEYLRMIISEWRTKEPVQQFY